MSGRCDSAPLGNHRMRPASLGKIALANGEVPWIDDPALHRASASRRSRVVHLRSEDRKVAVFNGHQTLGLSMEDADDLAHLLNASHPGEGGASAT